jgi:hypothetical protein
VANKIEAVIEIGVKIFKFLAAASFDNSKLAGIDNKAIRIQKIVPCICLLLFDEDESEPSSQLSKMTTAVKDTVINIPKSNLFLSILY